MAPSIFPTGTTIYHLEKCWNGFTVFGASMFSANVNGAMLIDMNGNIVNQWKGLDGIPNKILPGGHILGSTGMRDGRYGSQDMLDLVQVDWDGNIVWKFDRYEQVKDPHFKPRWMARQHHDYQRSGNPVGYYAPGMEPSIDSGNTLLLCHKNVTNPDISDKLLLDDAIIEVTWEGEIVWEWLANEHFSEMGFNAEAKRSIHNNPHMGGPIGQPVDDKKGGDWIHLNSASYLGPNQWYDDGDERFHPENIIWSGRNTNTIGIIDKKTGNLVWRLGPEYDQSPELSKMGWIIGPHHAHIIPRGLPGEGNILLFDNGGAGGYGAANPGALQGIDIALRDYSRVIEFNPVTLEVVWSTMPMGGIPGMGGVPIYSAFMSSAQRLPNGNTLIGEGNSGRILEVTPELEIAWEYVSAFPNRQMGNARLIYRAYRVPYEWIPQAPRPEEKAIKPRVNHKYRVPGSLKKKPFKLTKVR